MHPVMALKLARRGLYRIGLRADADGRLRMEPRPARVFCNRDLPADYEVSPRTVIHQPRVPT